MQSLFYWWLLAATFILLFIGVIWSRKSLLNLAIKMVYIVCGLLGGLIFYHRFILNLPL